MKSLFGIVIVSCTLINASAQNFLPSITPTFNNTSVKMSCRVFSGNYDDNKDFVDVLAVSSDSSVYDAVLDKYSPMKGNISDVYLFQEPNLGIKGDSMATVFLSFDKNTKDPILGDGGGLVFFKMKRNSKSKAWEIIPSENNSKTKKVYFRNINLSSVGGTLNNKKIIYVGSADGTGHRFLVVEDASEIKSNKDLTGFSDTSNYTYPAKFTQSVKDRSVIPANTSIQKYLSMGFPIEIDGKTGEVIGKMHRLGRGVTSMAVSSGTIIYALGGNPSILLQYSPFETLDKSGFLFAPRTGDPILGGDGAAYISYYKQNTDGSGSFLPLNNTVKIDTIPSSDPNNANGYDLKFNQIFDSLLVIKDKALKAGATMFANIGDIAITTDQQGNNVILITEKGIDNSGDLYVKNKQNGVLAKHLFSLDSLDKVQDGKFSDPYGRILSISPSEFSGILSVFTKGGENSSSNSFFSNPDRIEVVATENSTSASAIIVKENIPSISLNRNPNSVTNFNNRTNEAFVIELSDPSGVLPFSYNGAGQYFANPIPASDYSLLASSALGSVFSSGSGSQSAFSGSFAFNTKTGNGKYYDTYLMVENGYMGTDKSRLLAIRNLYPKNTNCVGTITSFENDNSSLESLNNFYYPNPTNGMVRTNTIGDYKLYDLSGSVIKSFQSTDILDLSDCKKGLYTIKNEMGISNKIVIY